SLHYSSLSLIMLLHPPRAPLFPYTTLFRSSAEPRFGGSPTRLRAVVEADDPQKRDRTDLADLRWRVTCLWSGEYSLGAEFLGDEDRKSTRLNSSHGSISYAVFCLKKKKRIS